MYPQKYVSNFLLISHLDSVKDQVMCIFRHKKHGLFLRDSFPWGDAFILLFSSYPPWSLSSDWRQNEEEARHSLNTSNFPFPTYPTQTLVSCLSPDLLPRIKCPSLPNQIPALVENFQPVIYSLTQISAPGTYFLYPHKLWN